MIFSTSHKVHSGMAPDNIKGLLLGQHIQVHHLDFEIVETGGMLKVIPHAENVEKVKTLPITHIEIDKNGSGSNVHIKSKPRKIDAGGPLMIVAFIAFMIFVSAFFFFVRSEEGMLIPLALLGVAALVFIIFMMRMQSGYYDYIRKIRHFIEGRIK